jgi:hypothetical protein
MCELRNLRAGMLAVLACKCLLFRILCVLCVSAVNNPGYGAKSEARQPVPLF